MDTFFTVPELKVRGWTIKMIEKFLPNHDALKENPWYRNAGAPMKLYKKKRVERAEKTDKFKAAMVLSLKRKESAKKGVATKTRQMDAFLRDLTISIPVMEIEDLLSRARANFYSLGLPVEVQISNERMCVNYLRHCESEYEALLDRNTGKVGGPAAYFQIKEKVLTQIGLTYEWLQDECKRQIEEMKRKSIGAI